ncbi:porin [Aquisalimonas lutea]|uniref:porin n=1 Tax=Aquisalimonas lutea TaxID=1327750 RepID=UPI0025B48A40|nr:porin [Aquisalimonas lutea]MDN3519417.1 porin [Aquisalimonas lutea]
MISKPGIAVTAALLLYAAAASAQGAPELSFNGFGTLGVVHSDEDQADFVSDLFAPDGAGYTRNWSPEVDSRLGLQLTGEITPQLTGVVQVIAEQRYDETYRPTVEWANLRYDVTPDLSLRAGRMVLPNFMVSEHRKVGYANPWIRPPQELYRTVPVTNTDGIGLSYRSRIAGFTNTVQARYGQKDAELHGDIETEARNGLTVANTLESGATSLFASYNRSRLTIDAFNPLFDAYRQFGAEGEAIADRYDVDDKRFEVVSVGARYDPGDWFVMGEWSATESRTFIGDSRSWYVSAGYRFGAITPYATIARTRATSDTSDPGLDNPQAQELNARLNVFLGSAAEQKSVSVGARWDFARNFALKVQYDRLDLDEGSRGVLINEQAGFRRGGTVNLFSAALDFVF